VHAAELRRRHFRILECADRIRLADFVDAPSCDDSANCARVQAQGREVRGERPMTFVELRAPVRLHQHARSDCVDDERELYRIVSSSVDQLRSQVEHLLLSCQNRGHRRSSLLP
jgi:hypothetical protein